jgi:hypothetical protein
LGLSTETIQPARPDVRDGFQPNWGRSRAALFDGRGIARRKE